MSVLLRGTLVSHGVTTADAWALVADGVFQEVGSGAAPESDETFEGTYLVPGFIDLHCHGGGGGAFDDGADGIARGLAFHRRHGTTRSLVSLVTASIADLVARTAVAARAARADDRILGVHLEGPFLSVERRGAHDPALLTTPTGAAIDALLAAGDGTIRQVTLAPELDGSSEAVQRLVQAGVRVAVGHTDATADVGAHAFDAGATIVTHAFNGMRTLDHRAPGVLAAAFDRDDVTIEVIADGVHVHPRMVRLLFENAPGRVALVSDAMSAAGLPDGPSRIGGLDVVVSDGVPRLVHGGSIAGSTLTLDKAVRTAVAAGVPLEAAVDAATRTPARALGVDDTYGSIAVGRVADAVVLDAELRPATVLSRGDIVR